LLLNSDVLSLGCGAGGNGVIAMSFPYVNPSISSSQSACSG
jgi:hypothetical protein